jgi:Bax protein
MSLSSLPNKKHFKRFRRHLISGVFWTVAVVSLIYPFVSEKGRFTTSDDVNEIARGIPDFKAYTDTKDKKRAFFNYLLPEVKRQNARVMQTRVWLLGIRTEILHDMDLHASDKATLDELAQQYKVNAREWSVGAVDKLLMKVDVIPQELVLVQAANESAWGTSRFARQGYNFFGLWCFQKGCGFVPSRRNSGAEHEVAKFTNLSHAVSTYLTNLNRHPAYERLRDIRNQLRDKQQPITAEALADGLMSYSERGQAYIDELNDMIRINRAYISE